MKIRFLEEVQVTLVHADGDEMDTLFPAGDVQEGELMEDCGEYISFGCSDGWQIHGLKKTQYEVVP